jgi:hypothetical protein
MASSRDIREKGNAIYKNVDPNLSPVVKVSRFKEAMSLYNKSLMEAFTDLDKTAACKNILLTSGSILSIYASQQNDQKFADYYALEGQKHANSALNTKTLGQHIQTLEWQENIERISFESINTYTSCLESLPYKQRIARLLKLKGDCMDFVKPLINYFVCMFYYRSSLNNDSNESIRKSLHDIKECNFYFEESSKQLQKSNKILHVHLGEELETLRVDFNIQTSVLEGLNSKLVAKDLLTKTLRDEESINFESIWEIVDWYKDSIIKTRDHDLECEAEVSSDLGYVYDKILKNVKLSKKYFKHAWDLAESLKPKILTKHVWYIRMFNAMKKNQQKVIDEENKKFEAEKAKVLDEIKLDLEEIDKKGANLDSFKFLAFVYQKHPPKRTTDKLDSPLNSSTIKKQLQLSVIHYHPDKNSKDQYGACWYFIADAITKNLTRYYELLK